MESQPTAATTPASAVQTVKPGPSTRAVIIALVVAAAVPGLFFAGLITYLLGTNWNLLQWME